ncbi:hypothetical protein BX600DRAFT_448867 [Xylariales sp. PMI_506]|nr:hypothetical protein BX600DRAFT_448867 [Xylariales sp. PMI_506]
MWSPLGGANALSNHTARWQPEPSSRGTFNILSTCLLTLSLCIWTALHLNIPGQGKANHQKWRKAKWLAIGLLAPEVVAFAAFKQWRDSKKLTRDVRAALGDLLPEEVHKESAFERVVRFLQLGKGSGEKPHDEPVPRVRTGLDNRKRRSFAWTETHSFYAVMGGFVLDNSGQPDFVPFPEGRSRLTLLGPGILAIAKYQPDILPDISRESITDKSKANQLAKALVCIQATWFCFQVITRMAFGLAITLLELNTFAHAICALIIYGVWWHKPLDVDEPTMMTTTNFESSTIYAAMQMQQNIEGDFTCWFRDPQTSAKTELFGLDGKPLKLWAYVSSTYANRPNRPSLERKLSLLKAQLPESSENKEIRGDINDQQPSQPLPDPIDIEVVLREHNGEHYLNRWGMVIFYLTSSQDVTKIKVPNAPLYITLNSRFLQLYRLAETQQSFLEEQSSLLNKCLGTRAENWPLESDDFMELRYFSVFVAAGIGYGAWHLTAWSGPFRSQVEEWLWRASGLGAGVLGILMEAILMILTWRIDNETRDTKFRHTLRRYVANTYVLVTLFIALGLSLTLCRCYLVVEGFVSLPYVPDSAFMLPNWSPYFPHIG